MKVFEAKTLEKAYELAKNEFKCSITQLEIEIIHHGSNGFLGIGRKNAIIKVKLNESNKDHKESFEKDYFETKNIQIEDVSKKIEHSKKEINKNIQKTTSTNDNEKEKIFNNFYELHKQEDNPKVVVKKHNKEILDEIQKGIELLFSNICYEINSIKVEFYDKETLYVEFKGKDGALLIGKDGYRYKALSYILFNWINEKYGLMLRLEIEEFLRNQEKAMNNYLEPIIEIIKERGSYKTKPLDGILVHIGLKKLRHTFPNKYIAVKTNMRGDRYILINEHRSKE